MRVITILLFCGIFFSVYLLAAESPTNFVSSHHQDDEVKQIEIEGIPKDFKIPSLLWDQIFKGSNHEEKSGNGKEENKGEKNEKSGNASEKSVEKSIIIWVPITVSLHSNFEDVLKSQNIHVSLPRGGGTIELNDFILGRKGSFYVQFLFDEFKKTPETKVYFYSRAKRRRIDGDVYGSGCNLFFDVTNKLLSINDKEGLKVNVTDSRHISVLGGHFIFVNKQQEKVFITQVEFTDKEKIELLCEN